MRKYGGKSMTANTIQYGEPFCHPKYSNPQTRKGHNVYKTCLPDNIMNKYVINNIVTKSRGDSVDALWMKIRKLTNCNDEPCVAKYANIPDWEQYYTPPGPAKSHEWLSDENIDKVLEQYEEIHKDYMHHKCYYSDVLNPAYPNAIKNPKTIIDARNRGKTKQSIVFNHDKYRGKGTHWVAFWIEFVSPKSVLLDYFDSVGSDVPRCPTNDDKHHCIDSYINILEKELIKNGYSVRLRRSSFPHQQGNNECGVYTIWWIIHRIHGINPEDLNRTRVGDSTMNKLRSQLFRPD